MFETLGMFKSNGFIYNLGIFFNSLKSRGKCEKLFAVSH